MDVNGQCGEEQFNVAHELENCTKQDYSNKICSGYCPSGSRVVSRDGVSYMELTCSSCIPEFETNTLTMICKDGSKEVQVEVVKSCACEVHTNCTALDDKN